MNKVLIAGVPEDTKNYVRALKYVGVDSEVLLKFPEGGKGVDDYDGLLLPGGDDIDPSFFGEELNGSRDIDRDLDVAQLSMTDAFVKAGKPILAICKGTQVMNVYFGGAVIQDLPTNTHHQSTHGVPQIHTNTAAAGSYLEMLFGHVFITNSYHHQANGRLGNGLVSILLSDDCVDEGDVHVAGNIMGLQWHPEKILTNEDRTDMIKLITESGTDEAKKFLATAGRPENGGIVTASDIADGSKIFRYFGDML